MRVTGQVSRELSVHWSSRSRLAVLWSPVSLSVSRVSTPTSIHWTGTRSVSAVLRSTCSRDTTHLRHRDLARYNTNNRSSVRLALGHVCVDKQMLLSDVAEAGQWSNEDADLACTLVRGGSVLSVLSFSADDYRCCNSHCAISAWCCRDCRLLGTSCAWPEVRVTPSERAMAPPPPSAIALAFRWPSH